MDIKLPSKWIKEYVKTNLEAGDLAKALSLGGPSIERWSYNPNLDDYIFNIEVTSNRADMASVIGIAREASAILKTDFLYKNPVINFKIKKDLPLKISIDNFKLCSRFKSIVMSNIKVKDSPEWMRNRLEACGINSINNIVDITNYVLLEYGQPMHAYDYDKVKGNHLNVRNAYKGEKIVILGNETVELSQQDLIIADSNEPLCIAGIKGGEKASITKDTKNIILEAANFEQYSIRKTSRRLNIKTEASSLFEKGLNNELTSPALLRAIELISELAGGEISSEVIDVREHDFKPNIIDFDIQSVEKVLGVKVNEKEILDILSRLGFENKKDKNRLLITVPFYRTEDVIYEYDLVEEIARIYGYHNIPSVLPATELPVVAPINNIINEDRVKDILVDLGFVETFSYSLISRKHLNISATKPENAIKLLNPLTTDFEYLRTELASSLIDISEKNETYESSLKFFELTKVYLSQDEKSLPVEQSNLVILLNGTSYSDLFYRLKGIWELLLGRMGIDLRDFHYIAGEVGEPYSSTRSARIIYKDNYLIGRIGLISKKAQKLSGLKKENAVIEVNFDYLNEIIANTIKSYKRIPKFPSINLDLSFIVRKDIEWRDVEDLIISEIGEYYSKSSLFDIFEDSKLGKGMKNIAFHLSIQSEERTLTDSDVNKLIENFKNKMLEKFDAKERL